MDQWGGPIFAALIAFAGAHWNGVRLEARRLRIATVSDQLKLLYGPLFSLSHAVDVAWVAFRKKYSPALSFFDPAKPPEESLRSDWKIWMEQVFMPMNMSMIKAIVEHADLIEGDHIPPSFLALIAHIEAYKVVLAKWDAGDFSENIAMHDYPTTFRADVARDFNLLKERQRKLLR